MKPGTTFTPSFAAARGVLHLLGGATLHAIRLAVAPDVRRHDALVPLVDPVAHRLPDEVVADREHLQPVLLEDVAARPERSLSSASALVHLEVIAPAGELEAVEAPGRRLLGDGLEWQVGPLAGEQRHGSAHHVLRWEVLGHRSSVVTARTATVLVKR